jgi:hypothetical protein
LQDFDYQARGVDFVDAPFCIFSQTNEEAPGELTPGLLRFRRGAELADQRGVLTARGAPQLKVGCSPEREQRLTDGAGGSRNEHAAPGPRGKEVMSLRRINASGRLS